MIEIKFDEATKKSIATNSNTIIGQCEYIELDNKWNIIHTSVDNAYQGQGIARKLVECVLEKAKANNKQVIADCSYAKKVLEKNNIEGK